MTHQEKKIKEIKKLTNRQLVLINQLCVFKKTKTIEATFKQAGRILRLSFELRSIELQIRLLMQTPTPKFESGGKVNIAVVGETGKESVINSNGKIIPA